MKTLTAIVITFFTLIVLFIGSSAQKGMLLATLTLAVLIILFYKYSDYTRNLMAKHDELKKAVDSADNLTGFIQQLDDQKQILTGKILDHGFKIEHLIGILKSLKLKADLEPEKKPSKEKETSQE
jgi:hypothetical protein